IKKIKKMKKEKEKIFKKEKNEKMSPWEKEAFYWIKEVSKKSADAAKNMANLLSSQNVINCISKYEKNKKIARDIMYRLGKIAYVYSEEVVISVADCISKFENYPEIAGEIAYWFGFIVDYVKSDKLMIELAKLISECKNPEEARSIVAKIGQISYYTESEEKALDALNEIKSKLSSD
ncbi:MAG: hypothetical protein QXI58_04980, partial [Candidatus Micrarchaeia archaeon]